MLDFVIHPNVYSAGRYDGLRPMLEHLWDKGHRSGEGNIYIISGFANFNGGARFYRTFKEHTENGGRIIAIFGGSANQRLSTRQVVEALLDCGAEVYIVNRKRLLHAKCYGTKAREQQTAIISSGNFTGPGLAQNIEASVRIEHESLAAAYFDWDDIIAAILSQSWQIHECHSGDSSAAFWNLLYDESPGIQPIDETEEETLVITLNPTDTNRILADKGEKRGAGSQYFWLSTDCFDFFPPLTIRNSRGIKGTLSTFIDLHYVDLGVVRRERVTFEAENNLDFRLGTGALRYTKLAAPEDIACLTRTGESTYELRILNQGEAAYSAVSAYACRFIGNKGKRYGYISNDIFKGLIAGTS